MDAVWVSVANLIVTGLLVLITAVYGKKFSEAKKAELEAKQAEMDALRGVIEAKQAELSAKQAVVDGKQAEIEAKQGVVEAKQAEIAAKDALVTNLEREIESLKELNPETLRKYTKAITDQLNDAIGLKEQENEKLRQQIRDMKNGSEAQKSRIDELQSWLIKNENEISVAQDAAKSFSLVDTVLTTAGTSGKLNTGDGILLTLGEAMKDWENVFKSGTLKASANIKLPSGPLEVVLDMSGTKKQE